ncbi:TVP38/TMEM64 family protein [Metabacillus sediminilitoris]|uniref:TVP38/TMEM64 family membrane protein n=1 Tax=Metabacillus sediminilitoris TaxID=2567941 RepID=A0A4V3WE43_9BACI|nr:VTT domain-containing protein [Metabacillus sediminilitoris]QGQ44846.1 TVP38/TMEM64 family protein [Metabacillus sediminilitoris]THF74771.1 TVP38/TMEM64 family protein [Metabacillus sediminilitoris]
MRKGLIFAIIYGVILLTVYYYRAFLFRWLNDSDFSQIPLMFFLSVVLSVVPIIPFSVFAGMMGAKYGIWIGSMINWFGSVGGAIIFFVLARYFFIHEFEQYVIRYKAFKNLNGIINRSPFITVLLTRLIYVIPPLVINIYSGLSTMSFKTYFFSTAIGQVPAMIVYAYLGNQLFTSFQTFVQVLALYIAFILVVLFLYRRWLKGKKSKVALE